MTGLKCRVLGCQCVVHLSWVSVCALSHLLCIQIVSVVLVDNTDVCVPDSVCVCVHICELVYVCVCVCV